MQTKEISRENWKDFFDQFSQDHESWLATLEVFGPDIGAQQEGSELPFEGITVSSANDEAESITLMLGSSDDDHVSHTVEKPTHVWLEQTNQGTSAALEIEAEDDSKALLRFRSTVSDGFVD